MEGKIIFLKSLIRFPMILPSMILPSPTTITSTP